MIETIWRSLLFRFRIFGRQVGQSTAACVTAMTQGDFAALTLAHWQVALVTGAAAGLIGVLVSIGPLRRHYGNRWFLAAVAFAGTFAGDLWAHPSHFGGPLTEAFVTALGAALFSLLLSVTPLGRLLSGMEEKGLAEVPPPDR